MPRRGGDQTSPGGQSKNIPAHEISIGRVKATLRLNHHEEHGDWYSVEFHRSYKSDDGQWKSAASFGVGDLLVVAELARLARLWIACQQRSPGVAITLIPGTGSGQDEPQAPSS
jgi:hypothetical protein